MTGCIKKDQRSPAEAIPHFFWLCQINPSPCSCKYCSKRTQSEVNASLGLSFLDARSSKKGTSSSSKRQRKDSTEPSPVQRKPKTREQKPRPVATKSLLMPKSIKPKPNRNVLAPPSYNGSYSAEQRSKDLGGNALYREHELVWVNLSSIKGHCKEAVSAREANNITHWPCIIKERTFYREKPQLANPLAPYTYGGTNAAPEMSSRQVWTYNVVLVACLSETTMHEHSLLPYCARSIDTISNFDPAGKKQVDVNGKLRRPNLSKLVTAGDVGVVFALALQISATIAIKYSLAYVHSFLSHRLVY